MTRYLKRVHAAELAGIGDFPRRQTLGARPRKVTRELAGGWLVPAPAPPGICACNQRTPGRRWQADPARRAASGPSTGSGAAALPFQHAVTATGSNEACVRARGLRSAHDAPAAACPRPQKAIYQAQSANRFQITSDMRGLARTIARRSCHVRKIVLCLSSVCRRNGQGCSLSSRCRLDPGQQA